MGVNWGQNSYDPAQCIVLSLFAGIMMFGKISGNFNPAVSTAILVARTTKTFNYNLKVYIITVLSQLIGGALGCAFSRLGYQYLSTTNDGQSKLLPAKIGRVCPPQNNVTSEECKPEQFAFQIFQGEAMGTLIFCSVILAIITINKDDGPMTAFAIVGTLYGSINIASTYSGGCINPAVAITQTVYQNLMKDVTSFKINATTTISNSKMSYGSMIWYVIGPLVGAVVAGFFWRMTVFAQEKAKAAQDYDQGLRF